MAPAQGTHPPKRRKKPMILGKFRMTSKNRSNIWIPSESLKSPVVNQSRFLWDGIHWIQLFIGDANKIHSLTNKLQHNFGVQFSAV